MACGTARIVADLMSGHMSSWISKA